MRINVGSSALCFVFQEVRAVANCLSTNIACAVKFFLLIAWDFYPV